MYFRKLNVKCGSSVCVRCMRCMYETCMSYVCRCRCSGHQLRAALSAAGRGAAAAGWYLPTGNKGFASIVDTASNLYWNKLTSVHYISSMRGSEPTLRNSYGIVNYAGLIQDYTNLVFLQICAGCIMFFFILKCWVNLHMKMAKGGKLPSTVINGR